MRKLPDAMHSVGSYRSQGQRLGHPEVTGDKAGLVDELCRNLPIQVGLEVSCHRSG